MAPLGPPPVDSELEQKDGKASPPWVNWFRQLWDSLRRERVIAIASRTSAQTGIASATRTIVDFNVVATDTHSAITTGANWKFRAPRAGYYRVETCVLFSSIGATAYLQGFVYKNGAELKLFSSQGDVSSFAGPFGAVTVSLADGDEIDIRVHHAAGSNQQTTGTSSEVWVHIFEEWHGV